MIASIPSRVTRDDAERAVRASGARGPIDACRKVYYPYYSLELSHTVRTVVGHTSFRVACMVDSRTGLGATADSFEIENVTADDRDVFAPKIETDEAKRIAERYVGYALRRRRRAFVAPTIAVETCRLVYKPFWIVSHAPGGRVLVDAVLGGFYPLRVVR